MMIRALFSYASAALIATVVFTCALTSTGHSAPSAEVAKKCLRYAYRLYPYQRPGSGKGSNARQIYFSDCLAKNADVPEPTSAHQ